MRILFFNRWVGGHLGGTEKHIIGLASGLAQRGHEIHILTTAGDELNAYRRTIAVWDVPKNRSERPFSRSIREDPFLGVYALLFLLKVIPTFLRIRILGIKFDVISVHSPLEGLLLLLTHRFLGTPYAFVLEGYTRLEAWLAQYSDSVVALSDSLAEKCLTVYRYRPRVINVGSDRSTFSPRGAMLSIGNRRIILSVSRLSTHKRIDVLIKASALLSARLPKDSFRVFIVGDGKDRMVLERQVDDSGLRGVVVFAGRLSEVELSAYYRSASVFVSCEAAPDDYWITCQEALCCGAPIIWTSRLASEEEFKVRNWGVVVPPENPGAMARAIAEVLENGPFQQELRRRALEMAAEFDWKLVIPKYEEFYAQIIRRRV